MPKVDRGAGSGFYSVLAADVGWHVPGLWWRAEMALSGLVPLSQVTFSGWIVAGLAT